MIKKNTFQSYVGTFTNLKELIESNRNPAQTIQRTSNNQ